LEYLHFLYMNYIGSALVQLELISIALALIAYDWSICISFIFLNLNYIGSAGVQLELISIALALIG